MEEPIKKWVLIAASISGMLIFCYYAFYQPSGNTEMLMNPSTLDNSPSKQKVYAEKRKRERQFNYDRKVSSLDNFLNNEVNEDPFDTSSIAEPEPSIKDTVIKPAASAPQKTIIKIIEQPVLITEEPQITRRSGFASGSGDVMHSTTDENTKTVLNIPVVVHGDASAVTGKTIKLRTLDSFKTESGIAPENTFLYGKVHIGKDRLFIEVTELTVSNRNIPIALEAYDMNGNRGLLITGGIDKEITGQVMERAVGEVQRNIDVPILRGLPFTSAKKKIREKAIPINSGLKLYLREK